MKLLVRLIKILFISVLASAIGASASYYYFHLRLVNGVSLQSLEWEPVIVMASLWLVLTLLAIFFINRKSSNKSAKKCAPPLVICETLSDAAISDLKKVPAKDSASEVENNDLEQKAKKFDVPESKIESKSKPKSISDKTSESEVTKVTTTVESSGIIKWFNGQKGYGFITSKEGEEVFVHCRSIKSGGKRQLHTGQQVNFNLIRENKGLKADEVVIIE